MEKKKEFGLGVGPITFLLITPEPKFKNHLHSFGDALQQAEHFTK
jgi:hypothetical protein